MSLIKVSQNLASSWWTHPEVVAEAGTSNILFGGVMTNGDPRIFRKKPTDLGVPATVENAVLLDPGDPDDHNSVSILSLPGKKLVAFWQRHSSSPYLNWWRAPEGTFAFGSKLRVAFPENVAYSQVFNISGNRSIVFVRCTGGWYFVTTDDHFATVSAPKKFLEGSTGRIYLNLQPSPTTPGLLHFAGALNPGDDLPHWIVSGTIDLVSGDVRNGAGVLRANLFALVSGLPIDETVLLDLGVADSTSCVRLLDVHEVNGHQVVLYAKWSDTEAAAYWVAIVGGPGESNAWVPLGILTGAAFGPPDPRNYVAGAQFDRARGGIYLAREEAGVSYVEYYGFDIFYGLGPKLELQRSATYRLVRPYPIRGGDGAVWQEIHAYTGYTEYSIHQWLFQREVVS